MDDFAPGPVSSVAICPHGQQFAAAAGENLLATGVLPSSFDPREEYRTMVVSDRVTIETSPIASLCFPGENIVYAASSAGSFARYFVEMGKPATVQFTVSDPHGVSGPLTGIASVNSESLIVTSGRDKFIRCWDPETRQCVARLSGHKYEVRAVAVAQSSVEASGELVHIVASGGRDKTVRLWDVRASESNPIHVFSGHSGWVHDVAISGCGPSRPHPILMSCAGDKTVRMWNLAMMKEELVLSGHEYRVWGVAVASDGSFAVSGSTDATVRAWNLAPDVLEGERCHAFTGHRDSVLSVSVSRDGAICASGCEDGSLYVWNTSSLFGRLPHHVHEQEEVEESNVFEALHPSRSNPGTDDKVSQFRSHDEFNEPDVAHDVSVTEESTTSDVLKHEPDLLSIKVPDNVEHSRKDGIFRAASSSMQDLLQERPSTPTEFDWNLPHKSKTDAISIEAEETQQEERQSDRNDTLFPIYVSDPRSAQVISSQAVGNDALIDVTVEEGTSGSKYIAFPDVLSYDAAFADSAMNEHVKTNVEVAQNLEDQVFESIQTAFVANGDETDTDKWITFDNDVDEAGLCKFADVSDAMKKDDGTGRTISKAVGTTDSKSDTELDKIATIPQLPLRLQAAENLVESADAHGTMAPSPLEQENSQQRSLDGLDAGSELKSIHNRLLDISRRLDVLLQG